MQGNPFSEKEYDLFRRYQMLNHRLVRCEKLSAALRREIEGLEREAKLAQPQYFGECFPPASQDSWRRVDNGIYLSSPRPPTDGFSPTLAVHESVSQYYLTAVAAGFGEFEEDYLFFMPKLCAPALFELSLQFHTVRQEIICLDSLYATLYRHFSAYTQWFNDLYMQDHPIPQKQGPDYQFLLSGVC